MPTLPSFTHVCEMCSEDSVLMPRGDCLPSKATVVSQIPASASMYETVMAVRQGREANRCKRHGGRRTKPPPVQSPGGGKRCRLVNLHGLKANSTPMVMWWGRLP